jgi:hypothetical protein
VGDSFSNLQGGKSDVTGMIGIERGMRILADIHRQIDQVSSASKGIQVTDYFIDSMSHVFGHTYGSRVKKIQIKN